MCTLCPFGVGQLQTSIIVIPPCWLVDVLCATPLAIQEQSGQENRSVRTGADARPVVEGDLDAGDHVEHFKPRKALAHVIIRSMAFVLQLKKLSCDRDQARIERQRKEGPHLL